MSKQEKIIWLLLAGILVVLYLLSSTDLIIKEKQTDIYPVSVIVADTSDEYYVNFRKGVDKAADEYHVDVSFITLYEKRDSRQQMDLVKREMEDGAGAVILDPVNPGECIKELDGMVANCPLIMVGDMPANEMVKSGITMDYQEAGRKLAQAVVQEQDPGFPVYVFTQGLQYGYSQQAYEGLVSVLEEKKFHTILCERKTPDTFKDAIEGAADLGTGKMVAVALDVSSLDGLADIISGSPVDGKQVAGLYGIGCTTKILNQLDRGVIRGLIAINQFDQGYLSVEKAVSAIKKKGPREKILLDSYYIEKKSLRERRYEKILYPID